jgi:hypothetical protein
VHAQVQLDRLFPPAVSGGLESSIQAEGKFPNWPTTISCDRDDVTISTGQQAGELKVTLAADAAPGVAWVRMRDGVSVSQLVPLMIEPQPPSLETEPNNKISEANALELPRTVVGRLDKNGEVDTFRITVRSGQTLIVSAIANELLKSPMDVVLQLVDSRGNVLQQTDDSHGLDPQVVYQVREDGDLYVRLFAFPETANSTIGYAGEASFVYLLRITAGAFVDHLVPLLGSLDREPPTAIGWNLPGDSVSKRFTATKLSPPVVYVSDALGWHFHPQVSGNTMIVNESTEPLVVDLPGLFSGHLSRPAEIDRVRFRVQANKRYHAEVQSRKFGYLVDSVLKLVDPHANEGAGADLVSNDDRQRDVYDAELEYQAKADGEVELQISDLLDAHGPSHVYSVMIQESVPTAELTVSDDRYQVQPEGELEIAVDVSRRHGFDQKLQISAVGLLEAVTVEPVTSEAKGDSAKSVKLKLKATAQAAGIPVVFRIEGHVLDEAGQPKDAAITAFYQLRPLISTTELWLSIKPK